MTNHLDQRQLTEHGRFLGTDTRLSGCINEIRYRSESPTLHYTLLLPLLQQLGHQSRWQLWLSPLGKISRKWLTDSGLPVAKSVQLSCLGQAQSINAILGALSSGNFSIVVAWFAEALTKNEKIQLELAAIAGKCTAIILLPETSYFSLAGQEEQALIPSNVLH